MANEFENIGEIEAILDINQSRQAELDAIEAKKQKAQEEFDLYARDAAGDPFDLNRVEAYKNSVEPWRFEQSLYTLQEDHFNAKTPEQLASSERFAPALDKYLKDNPEAFVNLDAKDNRDANLNWVDREQSHHYPMFSGEARAHYENLGDNEYQMLAVAGYISEADDIGFNNVVDNIDIFSAKYAAEYKLDSPSVSSVFNHIKGNLSERQAVRDRDKKNWSNGISSVLNGLSYKEALTGAVDDKDGAVTNASRSWFMNEFSAELPKAKEFFDKFAAGGDKSERFIKNLEERDFIGMIADPLETPKQMKDAVTELVLMPQEQRRKTLALMWMMAEDQAGELEAGFFGKSGESFMRGLDSYVRNIDDAVDTSVEGLTRDADLNRMKREMHQDLRDIREVVSEIKSDSKIIQGVYDASRSMPYMLSAAIPYGGVFLNAAAMATDNDIKLRRLYPDMDEGDRWEISLAAGTVQSGIERLSFKTWMKGFPSASQYLAGKGVAGKIGVLGVRGAGIVVTENIEESIQSGTLPVMQSIWAAIGDDIPEVSKQDWEESLFLYDEKTFFATLPLAVLGAGGRTAYDAIGAKVANEMLSDVDKVMLHGFSEQEAKAIAGETDSLKKWLMFKEGSDAKTVEERRELSEQATDNGALDRVIKRDEEQSFQEHEAKVNETGTEEDKVVLEVQKLARDYSAKYDASIEMEDDQFVVSFPDGKPSQTFETKSEADSAVKAHQIEVNESYLNALTSASANVQAMALQKKTLETKHKGAEIKTGVEIIGLKEFAEKSDENMKQALERIEHELLKTGEVRPATRADLDRWHTRGQVKLKKDARGYVARLTKGANIADLVEEGSEGFLRDIIENGIIEEKWVKEQIMRYQDDTGNRLTKAESVDQMSYQQMVEAFSDLAVSNFYNAHQQDKTGALGSIINALRIFFAKVAKVAEDLMKLQQEGRIDADFQTLLDNSVGLGMDEQIERQTEEAHREIMGEQETPSMSIGRSTITPTANTRVFPTADGAVVGGASFSIGAWHGTPHKVGKFSTKNIGTGEGAQAYGWGLYFAEDKAVSEQYRIALAYDPDKQRINGRQINDEYNRYTRATATQVDYQIAEGLERLMMHASPAEVIEMFEEEGYSKEAIDYFKESDYETFGGLYKVELNVEQDELLDWDKPLSEQSEKVREMLKRVDSSESMWLNTLKEEMGVGGFIYKSLAATFPDAEYVESGIGGNQKAGELFHAAGIKGIKYLDGDSRSEGEGTYNYVIFDDKDIRITEENGKAVDTTSFSIAPAFYSKMEQVLEQKIQGKQATPEQIKSIIDPSKGSGVKAEEIKWTGIEQKVDELAAENNGKVPKDALLAYLRDEGAVRFEEVRLGVKDTEPLFDFDADGYELRTEDEEGNPSDGMLLYRNDEEIGEFFTVEEAEVAAKEHFIDDVGGLEVGTDAEFAEYQLEGGKNYREVVLAMPQGFDESQVSYSGSDQDGWQARVPNITNYGYGDTKAAALGMLKTRIGAKEFTPNSYTSSHFPDVPNYVAHMRTNERQDSTGDEGLFIEEIQSDRHQEGRKEGYKEDKAEPFYVYQQTPNGFVPKYYASEAQALNENPGATVGDIRMSGKGVPDAPFRKDWHMAMFKRALRDAVAGGKDWIGWTTGETQNERYDLSKQVKEIVVPMINKDGSRSVRVEVKENRSSIKMMVDKNAIVTGQYSNATQFNGKKLDEVVGKDVAEKIMNLTEPTTLTGNDLTVGGSGMKGFYDNILPKEIGKYVKQWGAKVEDGSVKGVVTAAPDVPIHKVTITDAMRESIREVGQPSFSIAPAEDSLMERITALMRDPDAKLEIYKDMASRLNKVRERIYQKYIAYGKITDATMTESEREMDEREFIISSVAQMEAIARVLPPEVRSSLGTMKQLSTFKSGKAMRRYITSRLDKADTALEKYLRKELRADVQKLIKQSQPTGKQKADAGRSKLGDVGHSIAGAAMKAIKMSPEEAELEAQKERTKLDQIDEPTVDEIQEYEDVAYTYEMFADIANADSNRLTMMKRLLKTNWDEGRKQWKGELSKRKAWRESKISDILTGLNKLYKSLPETNRAQKQEALAKSFSRELLSFYQITDMLREDMKAKEGSTVKEMADDFRRASNAFEWAQLQHKEEMKEVFSNIFGIKGVNKTARVQARLNALAKGVDWGSRVTVSTMYDYKVAANAAELDQAYQQLQADPELDRVDIRDKNVSKDEFNEMYIEYQNQVAGGFVPTGRKLFRHTINRNTGERVSVGEMSQLDLLKDWLAVQQLDLKDKYDKSGHDEQYRQELQDALDDDVQELGLWMQGKLREMTPETDKLHRSEYGLAMATVENYFPAVFEHVGKQETSLQIDGIEIAGVSKRPSAHKMRVNHNARPKRQNAVNVFNHHIMQDAFWKTHTEVLRKWAGVLRDKDVQDGILRAKGSGFLKTMNTWLENIETQGSAVAQAQIESDRVWRSIGKGMALGVLGLKLSTIMKNIAAGFNPALGVEAKYLIKGLRPELFSEAREILKSETFQRRLRMGATVATRYALQGGKAGNLLFSTSERLAEVGIQGINIADTESNMTMALAYTAKLRELRGEGVADADAKAQALDFVDDLMARFAQPADRLSKSLAENTRMPQAQFIVMFQSEVRKMMSINALALRKLFTGKGVQSRSLAAQQLIVQVVLVNAFIHTVSALYGAMFRGFGEGDDAEEKFINDLTDGNKLAANMLADSLSGVPVFGEAWAMAVRSAFGQDVFTSTSNPAVRAIGGTNQLLSLTGRWDDNSPSENADAVMRGIQSLAAVAPQTAILSELANVGRDSLGFVNNALSVGIGKQDTLDIYEKRIKKVTSYVHADTKDEMKEAKDSNDRPMIRSIETQRREEIINRSRDIFLEMSEEYRREFLELQRDKENGVQKYIIRELNMID